MVNSKLSKNTECPIPMVRPPYLYGQALLIGIILNFFFPLPFIPQEFFALRILLGITLAALGMFLIVWAVKTLTKSNVDPRFKPVGNIVSAGPFGFTRNPMYVSFTLIYIGISTDLNALWPILFLPAVIAVLHYGVIKHEEHYLEARFGEEYKKYCAKVRRWL